MRRSTCDNPRDVARAFVLVGAIGLVVQTIAYVWSGNGPVAVATGMPFLVFFVVGVALWVRSRRFSGCPDQPDQPDQPELPELPEQPEQPDQERPAAKPASAEGSGGGAGEGGAEDGLDGEPGRLRKVH